MIDNYSQQVKYKEPLLLFHQDEGATARTSAPKRGRCSRSRFRRADWPSATTTTTAAWTSWWGTTAGRRSCCTTTQARETTGWVSSSRDELQSRRGRRAADVVRRGREAFADKERRRQLPFRARSARGAGRRRSGEDRLARDPLAAAQRPHRAIHGCAGRSLRDHRRGEGNSARVDTCQATREEPSRPQCAAVIQRGAEALFR